MNDMIYALLKSIILALYNNLSPEQFHEWADIAIEKAKDIIEKSETPIDDELLLPLLELLDKAFGKTD